MTGWRLPAGGRIDRGAPIEFTWDGRVLHGFAGDTLASALLANGVSVVGRSFKYHRRRGLIAAGIEEPNGLVQLETGAHLVPNIKATQVELYPGLSAAPQNAWPGTGFDILAVNGLFKRFIPAAFYYKTFMWPGWKWFEPAIRSAAGLGVAPALPDPDTYEHRYDHTDTLIVGSGPAALAAAMEIARTGTRLLIVEAETEPGGSLLSEPGFVESKRAQEWLSDALTVLRGLPNVTIIPRCIAFGYYDHGLIGLCERLTDHMPIRARSGPRQRMWKVRADRVILATGAFERPCVFPGNDLPGIMLASASQCYALRYGVAPGKAALVATNNDSAYLSAFSVQDAGVDVKAILDTRPDPGEVMQAAQARGISVMTNAAPRGAYGRRALKAVEVMDCRNGTRLARIPCDTLLMSDGWNPAVHLYSQAGGTLRYDDALRTFVPKDADREFVCVGAAAGVFGTQAAIDHARETVISGIAPAPVAVPIGPSPEFADGDSKAASAWVDFQNDVTAGDVQIAARENFLSVEHLKRYTTLGMASDQGKTSNVTGIHILASTVDKHPAAIGTTKFRPPFDPMTIGAFAGRMTGEDLSPLAFTPSHELAVTAGAHLEDYGGWSRAAFFRVADENEETAIAREVTAVRNVGGLFDASPLGKIEVSGPDAAEFLDRMYVNNASTLKTGRCRYGIMLTENGIVFDDGVFARTGPQSFLVGTTSSNAARVADHFDEYLQCEWPDLRVLIENVTTCWATVNIAGPQARQVLSAIGVDGIDLSPEGFPHMSFRSGHVAGASARVQRVSYTGELSYEVSVPWGYGRALWAHALDAGSAFGIVPFGIEAMMRMRLEKGFLHIGSDTDGTTMPQDIGFGGIAQRKSSDYVGRRSTTRPDGLRANRRQLVGLDVTDGGPELMVGAHILPHGASEQRTTQGWVTSSGFSPTLKRTIALAMIENGRNRTGEAVRVWDLGSSRDARITDQRFFDPEGEKLNG